MILALALMFRWLDGACIHRCLLASLRDALVVAFVVRFCCSRLPVVSLRSTTVLASHTIHKAQHG